MPFDGARWAIELAAVDKTAMAFASVDKRMMRLQASQDQVAKGGVLASTSSGVAALGSQLGVLAAGFVSVAAAQRLFATAMKAADLGEQAEQVGVNTDQLQAYRLAGAQAGIETGQMDAALTKLARTMGAAADGGKEQIALFDRLGVKLLDARGELRPTADVLPEVARGVREIGSSSQRTATLMDLFGKSGAKMATVLQDLSAGNAAVIASARAQNAIVSPEAIAAWDALADHMKVAEVRFTSLVGELGAPVAMVWLNNLNVGLDLAAKTMGTIKSGVQWLTGNMPGSIQGKLQGQVDALNSDITAFIQRGYANDDPALKEIIQRRDALVEQLKQNPITMPPITVTGDSGGVSNPATKGSGGTDPYAKIIRDAQQYIALKDVETRSLGMNAAAAAELKHQQELLGKVTAANIALTPRVTADLDRLAAAMAQADAGFAMAKFMDDAVTKSQAFIAAQQVERDTLFMSTEAAAAYRIEQELLNAAKEKGITLSVTRIAQIQGIAGAQAAAGENTRRMTELVGLSKDTLKGFILDLNHGIREGAGVWDIFGNAGLNALDRISAKLLDMAVNDLFSQAFGGVRGAAGGFLGSLFGGLFGGGGGVTAVAGPAGGYGGFAGYAMTLPGFATGGVPPIGVPYLVGERGPEVRVDGRPGQIFNRGQWDAMGGSSSGRGIMIVVTGDTDLVRVTARDEAGRAIAVAAPQIEGRSVKQATQLAPRAVAHDKATRSLDWRMSHGD
ncbi:hypothetical protein [Reyranella sp.]|uniref:hypothetical protein n=1 Tax=Reyranella sp. TaxID=1929291 RepID=UPI003D0A50E0